MTINYLRDGYSKYIEGPKVIMFIVVLFVKTYEKVNEGILFKYNSLACV